MSFDPYTSDVLAFLTIAVVTALWRYMPDLQREPLGSALRAVIAAVLYVGLTFATGRSPDATVLVETVLVVLGAEGTRRVSEVTGSYLKARRTSRSESESESER